MTDRPLPASVPAEMALVGAALVDNRAYDTAKPYVSPEDFADSVHGQLWAALACEVEAGRVATPVTLAGAVGADLDARGGHAYLAKLVTVAALPSSVQGCAKAIRTAAHARNLIAACEDARKELFDRWSTDSVSDLASGLQETLDRAREDVQERRGTVTAVDAAFSALQAPARPSVSTGLVALDAIVGGFSEGQLIVGAGATGMGKTAFALAAARAAARVGFVPFFSLEMRHRAIGARLLSMETGAALWRVHRQKYRPGEEEYLHNAARDLASLPLYIDDNGLSGVRDVRARSIELRRHGPLSLIVVDYIQLLMSDQRSDNRAYEVARITRGLKQLAQDLAVPVLALSQLSRKVDSRDNKRPELGDLRESGSIEQDADVVLFCYRPGYYVERDKPDRAKFTTEQAWKDAIAGWEVDVSELDNQAEIIVAKQRQGPSNKAAAVRFERDTASYVDLPGMVQEREAGAA